MKSLDPEVVKQIRAAHGKGEMGKAIAARLGISPAAVSRIVRGSRHGRRITPMERAEVRRLLDMGMPNKVIAIKMNMSLTTIHKIAHGPTRPISTIRHEEFDHEDL